MHTARRRVHYAHKAYHKALRRPADDAAPAARIAAVACEQTGSPSQEEARCTRMWAIMGGCHVAGIIGCFTGDPQMGGTVGERACARA